MRRRQLTRPNNGEMIMDIAKREFLAAGLGLGIGMAMVGRAEAQTAPALKPSLQGVKVIVFDTFGSVVDWRGSIIKDLSAWGAKEGLKADWAKLADDWRLGHYGQSLNDVRTGKLPWMNLDRKST